MRRRTLFSSSTTAWTETLVTAGNILMKLAGVTCYENRLFLLFLQIRCMLSRDIRVSGSVRHDVRKSRQKMLGFSHFKVSGACFNPQKKTLTTTSHPRSYSSERPIVLFFCTGNCDQQKLKWSSTSSLMMFSFSLAAGIAP